MDEPAIQLAVENVGKAFDGHWVLRDISFQVRAGEFCILLGPSGCGKSTLLRLVAGLEELSTGVIRIAGQVVNHLAPRDRDVAMVFQSYALYPHMSVYDNMAFGLRMRKTPREEIQRRVLEAARLLEIEDLLDRKPRALSGGQRQRVAMGRAIVRQPKLSLFDEPLSNLDAQLRAAMRVELAKLHRRLRATTLYVTHDQVEAMTLGDKIVVLYDGRIQQVGTPQEIYRSPANLFVAGFIGSPPINRIEGVVEPGPPPRFRCPAFTLPAPREVPPGPVTLGIRPEDVEVGDGEGLQGTVEMVEHLGAEQHLHVAVGSVTFVLRVPPDRTYSRGRPVALRLDPRRCHWFRDGTRVG